MIGYSKKDLFSDNQIVTNSTGSVFSTDTLDLGAHGDILGGKAEIFVFLCDGEAAATSTFKIDVMTCDTEGGTYSAVASSAALPKAELVPGGFIFKVAYPEGLQRFVKIRYTIGTAAWTSAAVVTAGIAAEGVDAWSF